MFFQKAKQFVSGRLGQMARIEQACQGQDRIVWVHAASFGEFEEARPVLQYIRRMQPSIRILATFFSPSGYEYLKGDPLVDWVFYLPLDTRRNARRFLDAVHPCKVIVSISDYWLHFLHELRRRRIDTYLISARFIPSMVYFKAVGRMYADAFRTCFTKIIVRDDTSLRLMQGIGANAVLAGDPRMDRVLEIADAPWTDPVIEAWAKGEKVFVAGSTLSKDVRLVASLVNAHPGRKFLIVPHETGPAEVSEVRKAICRDTILYSAPGGDADVLVVDAVGILARLYRYGFAAYVGGGFDGSPHSIVEPAAYGIPVAYGPEFGSHYHCVALQECGGGQAVRNAAELSAWYDRLVRDQDALRTAGAAARRYCEDGAGVAGAIYREIFPLT